MPAFEYLALNAAGKEERGIMEADTPRQVRQLLRNGDLVPMEVNEVAQKQKKSESGSLFRGGRLRPADLALMTRQLATLVRAGSPVEEALGAVVRQTERNSARRVFSAIRARVTEGHSLANSLGLFPGAFPALYRATVGAGEQSGHLPEVLERLADYTENRQHSQQKVTAALVYPMVLLLVAVGVVSALLRFVVPKVVEAFATLDIELPLLTRMLIASSDFLRDYGLALLVGIGLLIAGIVWLLKRPLWKRRYHRLLLRLPVIGRIVRGVNTEHFARTFSILSSSGVPVLDAMKISAEVVINIPMREAVLDAAERVREGMPIHRALERSGFFPPMMVYLIASGEGSGKLDDMLERAAIQQERETQARMATLLSLLEPGLILFMGGIVTLIVLSIMLPVMGGMSKIMH
ncbi:MAG TPA: type II secretion system inner membrane protein GspF [Candidatus Thiothrix moscowensis]|uniref:type II secretion system inner membrane protein GspF n=1 Tax=unclassified Thiothrix TaxID=2636184 RepID=UPI001A34CE47|nr:MULTISPECIES: type II secretion system inner membrane protein GspF [unclassified Thiothrix]MBJ6609448.1 type II secretion system inner membrane protein GspF [Candidatus Thiothrix moscowensis]HRJ51981.1 type II secretion system inner membrane protein GspF [Candidatus Thiothrix moscowensis]HRJ92508.1 type II secretion system inner membrane protein GspF [Candidatus Thiothrix moscowensis]